MPPAAPSVPDESDEQVNLGCLTGFIGFRLRRIQIHLSRAFSERTQSYNLRSGALSALAIIEGNPGISQSIVAREIGMDTSAAVALLDELEQRGWIERKRLAQDRRRYAIHATDLGRTILAELCAILMETENAPLQSLSPHELLMFNHVLDKIYANCFSLEEE